MVEYIFAQSDGVTILLSTLLPNAKSEVNANVKIINEGIRRLVKEMQAKGLKIELSDMNTGFITTADLADGTHPRHDTYPKMATVWAASFAKVNKKGWICDPIDIGKSKEVCLPNRGPVKTSQGSGYDDGTYTHSSKPMGSTNKESYSGPKGGGSILKNFHYAQLVSLGADRGKENDELIRVLDPDQRGDLPYVSYKLNKAATYAKTWTTIHVNTECLNRGVRWGDINGDGLDDFICLNEVRIVSLKL